jgi:hypothetical protein
MGGTHAELFFFQIQRSRAVKKDEAGKGWNQGRGLEIGLESVFLKSQKGAAPNAEPLSFFGSGGRI